MNSRFTVAAVYALMCLIWGTTWLAIKIGLHSMGPLTGVGLRFLLAGVLLFGVAALRGELRPISKLPWKLIAVFAVFTFACDYTLLYIGETRVDSGLASVLFGTLPFFTFGFARVLANERLTWRAAAGSLAAFSGVALISLGGGVHGSPLYALAPIGAAIAAAFATAYAKRAPAVSPLASLPPAMTIAGTAMLAAGLVFERTDWSQATSPASLGALLYLAVAGSGIAFFCMLWLLERLPAGTIGLSSLTFPIIALTVGALFGGEHVGTRELAGSALVIIGMAIAMLTSFVRRGSLRPLLATQSCNDPFAAVSNERARERERTAGVL
ncbi:MAG TPA: EamA family transporter [Candidatus Baltobacteraceae bacterium]|nr:EamA family transporter [Candidatus Baltobacteraceae bacterium]